MDSQYVIICRFFFFFIEIWANVGDRNPKLTLFKYFSGNATALISLVHHSG